ncbi:MAG: transposase [Saprospiraceae bacterium]|nr:transposase [Saprospiraceae bacterium]
MTLLYQIVHILSAEYAVRVLCTVLSVCFSSFYTWKRGDSFRPSSTRMAFAAEVKKVFTEHRRRYGARRISKELQAQGLAIGRHQTATLMRQQELKAIQPKSFVPKTTPSSLPTAPITRGCKNEVASISFTHHDTVTSPEYTSTLPSTS